MSQLGKQTPGQLFTSICKMVHTDNCQAELSNYLLSVTEIISSLRTVPFDMCKVNAVYKIIPSICTV